MVKVIDVKDGYFKFSSYLRGLGFTGKQIENIAVKPAEEILDNFTTLQVARFKTAQNKVKRLEKNLKKAVSDNTLAKFKHGRRHGNRKYPGMVTGELKDSITLDLKQSIINKRWVYEFHGRVGSNHGLLTNENITRLGTNARTVHWYKWWDEAMGEGHSANLVGARTLMEELFHGGEIVAY